MAILIDTDMPQHQISIGLIVGIALMSLLIVTVVVGAIFTTRRGRTISARVVD